VLNVSKPPFLMSKLESLSVDSVSVSVVESEELSTVVFFEQEAKAAADETIITDKQNARNLLLLRL
jgi:hypothetical protein